MLKGINPTQVFVNSSVEECLYRTTAQLSKKLRYFCRYPEKVPFPQVCNKRDVGLPLNQYRKRTHLPGIVRVWLAAFPL